MEWEEFSKKYNYLNEEFNQKSYYERVADSRLMYHEAIRELIRSKKHLKDALKSIDDRIKILERAIEENNKILSQKS